MCADLIFWPTQYLRNSWEVSLLEIEPTTESRKFNAPTTRLTPPSHRTTVAYLFTYLTDRDTDESVKVDLQLTVLMSEVRKKKS